ncbi:MAG: hypothetical protein H0Z33_16365 [Bacillaceae bacterium]|nr:hypothetical protein [Bacillaceae bacterium]
MSKKSRAMAVWRSRANQKEMMQKQQKRKGEFFNTTVGVNRQLDGTSHSTDPDPDSGVPVRLPDGTVIPLSEPLYQHIPTPSLIKKAFNESQNRLLEKAIRTDHLT